MNIIRFLQPKRATFLLLVPISLLFSVVPWNKSYTTKITWDEYHGMPLSFLKLAGCYGPCSPAGISHRYYFQELDVSNFIADVFIWYVLACFIVYGATVLLKNGKFSAIVIRKK